MRLSLATLTLLIIGFLLYWILLVIEAFRISPTSPCWWGRLRSTQEKNSVKIKNCHLLMLFQTRLIHIFWWCDGIKLWSHTKPKMFEITKSLCHRDQTLGMWHGMLWMRRWAVWTPLVTWRLLHQSQWTGKVTHSAGLSLEWRSLREYHSNSNHN